MPKAKGFRDLREALEVRDANRLPQEGFFSTLDELINASPQHRMTAQQWADYLAPGRILEREGVKFPLKKEELEYTKLPGMLGDHPPDTSLGRDFLRDWTRLSRPGFRRDGMSSISGGQFNAYSTQGPDRLKYFESTTDSPDFGQFDSHFDPYNLSWQRGTLHNLDPENYRPDVAEINTPNDTPKPTLRLIDEIQSDRHAAAAEKGLVDPKGNWDTERNWPGRVNEGGYEELRPGRRGYRTPEQEDKLSDLTKRARLNRRHGASRLGQDEEAQDLYQQMANLKATPPDAPFKSAGDYGRLELKKGLLDAVAHGDKYLGVTPSEGPIGWFKSGPDQVPGMKHAYDSVYPGELEKLARQYGAPMSQVPLPVNSKEHLNYPILEDVDAADLPDFFISAGDADVPHHFYKDLHDQIAEHLPDTAKVADLKERSRRHFEALNEQLTKDDGAVGDEYDDLLDDWQPVLQEMHREAIKQRPDIKTTRNIPAMELTPSVVEKLKKAGVPLWAVTSGLVGGEALNQMINSDASGEPAPFAEGGEVKDDDGPTPVNQSLAEIDRIADYIGTPGKSMRRRQLAAGLASQLYGLDSKGNAKFLGADEPVSSDPSGSGMGEPGFPSIRPGLVDETLGLFNMFGNGPKFSKNASDRTDRLNEQVNHSMHDLPEPEGFNENFSRSLGVMLGQLPVPARKVRQGAELAQTGGKRLLELAKKYGTGMHEFMSPVVEPGVGTYGSGAVFGGTLGAMPGWLRDLARTHPKVMAALSHPPGPAYDPESRESVVGYADGGFVGMDDPHQPIIPYLSDPVVQNATAYPEGSPGTERRYIGKPKTEAELAHYGEGPETKYFDNNSVKMPEVNWSDNSTGTGTGTPTATEGGGNNALVGLLGSIPELYKGLGVADKVLGTGMQEGLKGLGSKAIDYGKGLLGIAPATPSYFAAPDMAAWAASLPVPEVGTLAAEAAAPAAATAAAAPAAEAAASSTAAAAPLSNLTAAIGPLAYIGAMMQPIWGKNAVDPGDIGPGGLGGKDIRGVDHVYTRWSDFYRDLDEFQRYYQSHQNEYSNPINPLPQPGMPGYEEALQSIMGPNYGAKRGGAVRRAEGGKVGKEDAIRQLTDLMEKYSIARGTIPGDDWS